MGEMDIAITYETIFEILKQEKERPNLQKLDELFFSRVVGYLKEKQQASKDARLSPEEVKKAEKQIENIKKMLKELYDRRERKLISMAIDKCKTNIEADESLMLKEEKQLLNLQVALLSKFRKGVIENVLNEKEPQIGEEKREAEIAARITENPAEADKDTALVRFCNAVPKFLGEDLQEYGPFEEEDLANLPKEIARVLINKGRVEEIE